jgi:hypothetical protein
MQAQGRLDEYWERVSIHTGTSALQFDAPRTVEDNQLAPILLAAVSEFLPTLNDVGSSHGKQNETLESTVTLTKGIQAIRAMAHHKQAGIDLALTHISNLEAEISRLGAEQAELKNSLSWRATSPLRAAHRLTAKMGSIRLRSSKFGSSNSPTTS